MNPNQKRDNTPQSYPLSRPSQSDVREERKRVLTVHWAIFCVINVILFFINYKMGLENKWFLWPLAVWSTIIIIHTVIVIIANFYEDTLETQLAVDGIITIVSSAYFIWNDWYVNRQLEWVGFVVIPLILIWLNHFALYRRLKKKSQKALASPGTTGKINHFDRKVEKELKLLDKNIVGDPTATAHRIVISKIILRNHIIIYFTVNLFLFFLGYTQGIDFSWFDYSSISWGVAIIFQSFLYLRTSKESMGKKIARKYLLILPASVGLYFLLVSGIFGEDTTWLIWAVLGMVALSLIIMKAKANHKLKLEIIKEKVVLQNQNNQMEASQSQTQTQTQPQSQHQNQNVPLQRFLDAQDNFQSSSHYPPKPSGTLSNENNQNIHVQRFEQAINHFCPNCGSIVKENQDFCAICGYNLKKH
ncbi:MAG: 2TM domain-containing protein [Promethearchaeota archaeon]